MKKVLITKLSSMGDLVHALPALTDAMNQIPEIEFDWVVDKNFADIPLWHPAVRNVFLTNHRMWRKNILDPQTREEFSSFYGSLKKQNYDLIIDAQGNIKSGLFSLIPKGKRAGWDLKSAPEWGSSFLYQSRHAASKEIHAIERIRHLFAGALDYEISNSAPEYKINLDRLKKPDLSLPSSYLMFVPIASYGSKLWPDELWEKLIQKATSEDLFILLPWGNLKEKERMEKLKVSEKVIVLPRLSINEMGYLILKAKAVVSVDTGLSHISAALSVPCVTLYGPTDPFLTGTIGENQHWIRAVNPCPKCKKTCLIQENHCLKSISPESAWEKLSTLL